MDNNRAAILSFMVLMAIPVILMAKEAKVTEPPLDPASISYSIGANHGAKFRQMEMKLDAKAYMDGLNNSFEGKKLKFTEDQMQSILSRFQAQQIKKLEEKQQVLAEKNLKEGNDFLSQNKSKEDVTSLPSGLQYKVIQQGTGQKPASTDTVTVHYKGMLIDGTEFDSSYKRNQPASFPVNGVIQGWQEALPLMPVGSKWQLFIPSELAYGNRGAGPQIGPNAMLIFEVELLSIAPKS